MSLIFICLVQTTHQKSAKLINILLPDKRFVLCTQNKCFVFRPLLFKFENQWEKLST
jgi:hypothetical protein